MEKKKTTADNAALIESANDDLRERIDYDPKVMQAWADRSHRDWRRFEALRMALYREALPWFGSALAAMVGTADEASAMKELHIRADSEWSSAMGGVKPLTSFDNLERARVAASKAGYPTSEAGMLEWVRDTKQAAAPVEQVRGDSKAANGKQPDIQEHWQQVAQAIGDDNAARILEVAQRDGISGERKMQKILRLDKRFAGKDSPEWSKLLGVTSSAVRGYRTWKLLHPDSGDD